MSSVLYTMKKTFLNCGAWSPLILGVRCKGLFPPNYLTPVHYIDELKKLESDDKLDELKLQPILPARTHMTNSLYDEPTFKHFTNMVMMWANRTLARQLMFDIFAGIKRIQLKKYYAAPENEKASIELNALTIFKTAIQNCQPVLALVPIKKGGITYQVPSPITARKSKWMAMKWLIMAGRDKDGPFEVRVGEISFVEQMIKEILNAYNCEGRVFKRKQDLHKICENNKAYAHYRWS